MPRTCPPATVLSASTATPLFATTDRSTTNATNDAGVVPITTTSGVVIANGGSDAAVIGGVVGGVVALLLLVGLVALFVFVRRRNRADQSIVDHVQSTSVVYASLPPPSECGPSYSSLPPPSPSSSERAQYGPSPVSTRTQMYEAPATPLHM